MALSLYNLMDAQKRAALASRGAGDATGEGASAKFGQQFI